MRLPFTTGLSISFSWITGDWLDTGPARSFLSKEAFRAGLELPVFTTGLGGWPWGGGPLGGAPATGPLGPRVLDPGGLTPLVSEPPPLDPLGLFIAPDSLGAPINLL